MEKNGSGRESLDLVIVGGGPAGLTAAIYAVGANLRVEVLERNPFGAGQIGNTNRVDNYPGFFGIGGTDLAERFLRHGEELGVKRTAGEVTKITPTPNGLWRIVLQDGGERLAKSVIYGAGTYHRKLEIPGEERFYGLGVSNCVICDGNFFRGKRVAVVGGGNGALEAAIYLSPLGERVFLIHRRDEFRGEQRLVREMEALGNVTKVLGVTPVEILGEKSVEGVRLSDGEELAVSGVFVEIGMRPNVEPIRDLAILDVDGYVMAGEDCKTALPGFFAVGDVRTKRYRQLVTAVGDGANGALYAAEYVRGMQK